ncbi:IclR family transcriptional regulator [Rhizobium sp. L1K21]|uniref:IclR family transcriptional regulator n=1 Tax=Rhizobium sp. L1K21 TaxID=2954933 RepID=UPI002092D615|nr:IclR family transcriptional regulator [Rhizobium sp. L1K21]MCO6187906.1 IclR family transcriptional regulator [Rhizobium sp. L1K21]
MSTTVAKALSLLNFFSEVEPELGLSELARRSGLDKATVHRMLVTMCDQGLLEQRGNARLYRLGAGVLRLARIRETAFPMTSVYQNSIDVLSSTIGETAHASLISGRILATIGISESNRGSRVSLVAGEILPMHSTASGLAFLAYAKPDFVERVLSEPLKGKTARTLTDPNVIRARLQEIRLTGYAEADQTNEDDVYGIAVPVFDADGAPGGAIAVATPAHRMTNDLRTKTIAALFREVEAVSSQMGGHPPSEFLQAVTRFTQSRA